MHTYICKRRTFKKRIFQAMTKGKELTFKKNKMNQESKQFRRETGAIHVK